MERGTVFNRVVRESTSACKQRSCPTLCNPKDGSPPGSSVRGILQARHLLLGRKVMTNLDKMLKHRDVTLPTNVHLVKAMVFPVVMYGCECWTIKKAECRRIDAFEPWCWRPGRPQCLLSFGRKEGHLRPRKWCKLLVLKFYWSPDRKSVV